jgi:hypothetical protein
MKTPPAPHSPQGKKIQKFQKFQKGLIWLEIEIALFNSQKWVESN